MEFEEFMKKNKEKDPENMLPNNTSTQEALDILVEHFLGKPIIYGYPASPGQYNTEVVGEILRLYPTNSIRRIRPRYKEA